MTILKIPTHIAVIMDGNFRWAKSRSLPSSAGHKAGSKAIKTLIKSSLEFKIKYLTIYAFSTENWQRPKEEVNYLMSLLKEYLTYEVKDLIKNGVKIVISGNLQNVEPGIVKKIKDLEEKTKNNENITLNVAFDYGSRQEIVDAFKNIAKDFLKKDFNLNHINEELVSQNLYQPSIPDPELLIRTSGEMRLSNFLLWQLAYTELYFTKELWPDFTRETLVEALEQFNQRKRNYGKR